MTNGSNTNTSGSAVANVGFIPRGVWQKMIDALGSVTSLLQAVDNGDATPAKVDTIQKGGVDEISDAMMQEIARRLVVTLENEEQGNVVFSPEPPDDKTKLWWQTDPLANLPIGRLKRWDDTLSQWVNVATPDEPFTPPARRNGFLAAPQGQSTLNFEFTDIGTTDYKVTLTPSLYTGTAWGTPPGSFPANFGFFIANKTNTLCSVAFYGIPVGGLRWEIDIEDRQTTS